MDFDNLKSKIKDNPEYKVTKEDKNRIYFNIAGNRFVVCENGTNFNIYSLSDSGVFMPGAKSGDSIHIVNHFVGAVQ